MPSNAETASDLTCYVASSLLRRLREGLLEPVPGQETVPGQGDKRLRDKIRERRCHPRLNCHLSCYSTLGFAMPSFRSDRSTPTPLRSLPITVSPVWITSAATVPLLTALMAGRVVSEGLTQIGLACEEVFRGSRLPLLKTSQATDTPTSEKL